MRQHAPLTKFASEACSPRECSRKHPMVLSQRSLWKEGSRPRLVQHERNEGSVAMRCAEHRNRFPPTHKLLCVTMHGTWGLLQTLLCGLVVGCPQLTD